MASHAARGKKALDEKNYEVAVKEYTAAIKESPNSPDYFIQRATAYTRLQKHSEALEDAEQGVINGQKRAKKESIIEAQFRRGVSLHQLGRYGDAKFILSLVKEQSKDHKQADMWINRNALAMQNLDEDDQRRTCTVHPTPLPKAGDDTAAPSDKAVPSTAPGSGLATSQPAVAVPQQTSPDKIRYEWYQNTENIYFTLLAKGVPKDKAQIDISPRALSISFPLTTGSSYDLTLEPLFAKVVPEKCITRVMPSKVEIILIKATVGQKWSAIESNEPVKDESTTDGQGNTSDAVKRAVLNENKSTAPAYPTSSKSGPKDWDKITSELRKADSSGKPGSLDDDDDYEGGDEANHFFKKLFKDASPEVQRAMMKSYTESNGTALSTNWEEVGKAKVETVPPDGMEAKKW